MSYTKDQKRRMLELAKFHIERDWKGQFIKTIEELNSLSKLLCKYVLGEKTIEELNDLSKILVKYDPDKDDEKFELLDELYDSDYMIFQLKLYLFGENEDSELFKKYMEIVNAKLYREFDRWLKK